MCRVHKSPPLVHIQRHINSVPTLPQIFLRSIFNLSFHLRLSNRSWALPFIFSFRNAVRTHIYHPSYILRPSHPSRFYRANNTPCKAQNLKLLVVQYNSIARYVLQLSLNDERRNAFSFDNNIYICFKMSALTNNLGSR